MNERLLPGAAAEDGMHADVVDAEILEDPSSRSVAAAPPHLADRLIARRPARRRPRSPDAVEARTARSDFLSWRSALTGAASSPTHRRLSWPRLLGFLAGALLFVVLVSLAVLMAL